MSRPGWLAVLAAVPVLFGLVAAALLQAGWLPNYSFTGQYHADLAALVSAGGVLLGLVLGWPWAGGPGLSAAQGAPAPISSRPRPPPAVASCSGWITS